MPGWKRADLEQAIDEGGSVVLPNGAVTRNKDDLPTEKELASLHESTGKSYSASLRSIPLGDPPGPPEGHDPTKDTEETGPEGTNPPKETTTKRESTREPATREPATQGGTTATGNATNP